MDHSQTAQLLQRVFTEVIDGGDYSRIDELLDPDYVDHGPMGVTHGHEQFTGMLDGFRAALSGFNHETSDLAMIDDSTAVWQVHFTGTFTGELMGVQGSGQQVDLWVANAARLRDGRVAEHWGMGPEGLATMMSQMGLQQPAAA